MKEEVEEKKSEHDSDEELLMENINRPDRI